MEFFMSRNVVLLCLSWYDRDIRHPSAKLERKTTKVVPIVEYGPGGCARYGRVGKAVRRRRQT
jgi:hypothetical protein